MVRKGRGFREATDDKEVDMEGNAIPVKKGRTDPRGPIATGGRDSLPQRSRRKRR